MRSASKMKKSVHVALPCTLMGIIVLLFFLSYPPVAKCGHDNENIIATWPSFNSDLQPDPSLTRGVLDNGLRYVIKQNAEPEHRVAAYLVVLAGSMHESDNQQGVAHFLEHMVFNGSTNYPPGTLIDYFQSIGMDFGGDTNAYTGFDQTVYHVILPTGDEHELEIGCNVLADFARGALLFDSEIDRERGVIFSEKRERDSAEYRNYVSYSDFAFKGTRYPLRWPIGKEEVLKKADHTLLKSFYDSWYRPDKMIVVLVGDLDISTAQKVIGEKFGHLRAGSVPKLEPDFGKISSKALDAFYNFDPELGTTNVSIESIWDVHPDVPTKALKKKELIQIIGDLIVGYRLEKKRENESPPFAIANYSSGIIERRIGYGSLSATTDGALWKETLASLHSVLERARLYGFTDSEVKRAKNEIYGQLKENVQTTSSQDSRKIAENIVNYLTENDVYLSPDQEKEIYAPMLAEITADDVNVSFRNIWSHPGRLVAVTGNTRLTGNAEDEILTFYKKAEKTTVANGTSPKDIIFPYLKVYDGPSAVAERREFPELKMTRYTMANGLVINCKKTNFEDNKIQLSANFGRGEVEESKAGMVIVADDVINLSGTRSLSPSALDTVLAGSSVDLSFHIGEQSTSLSGNMLSGDFEFGIQLLQALLLDPGCKEYAYKSVMQRFELMYKKLQGDMDGAMLMQVQPFLAGNNRYYGLPGWDEVRQLSFVDVKSWVEQLFTIKDLEISVVGDFDETMVVSILSKYFGGQHYNAALVRGHNDAITFPKGQILKVEVPSEIEKSTVVIAWPTDDFWDIGRTRRLSMVASILEDQIRKTIREEMGASYSPSVFSYGSRVSPHFGYILAELNVEKGKEAEIVEDVKKLVRDLRSKGVTEEELERAKKPIMTSVLENVKTNEYWLYSVLSLSVSYPEQLIWPTSIVDDISGVQLQEVTRYITQYLDNNESAVAIITSGKK
jgi:zinc protease